MAAFGVTDVDVAEDHVAVAAGATRRRTFDVEPDASSASYPLAIAAVRGGAVTVAGLTHVFGAGRHRDRRAARGDGL